MGGTQGKRVTLRHGLGLRLISSLAKDKSCGVASYGEVTRESKANKNKGCYADLR